MLAAEIDGASLDTFVASDDDAAKNRHRRPAGQRSARSGRRRPGQQTAAGAADAFGIELGQRYKLGFDFGFKYLPARAITPSS